MSRVEDRHAGNAHLYHSSIEHPMLFHSNQTQVSKGKEGSKRFPVVSVARLLRIALTRSSAVAIFVIFLQRDRMIRKVETTCQTIAT